MTEERFCEVIVSLVVGLENAALSGIRVHGSQINPYKNCFLNFREIRNEKRCIRPMHL
jgi:hypothetical protein